MKSFFTLLYFFAIFFVFNQTNAEETIYPTVSSFSISPSSANSEQPISFSWTLQGSGGYSFIIYCQDGIWLKSTLGGTPLPCDTAITSTTNTNDDKLITISNISGGTKTIKARVIPKDNTGQDYTINAKDNYFTINTSAQPITSFSSDIIDAKSGEPITLSWESIDLAGTNISIECNNNIKATSTNYSGEYLLCGQAIFPTNLPSTGSLKLSLMNYSTEPIVYHLSLLPAISTNTYDGTHQVKIEITVASSILPDPFVSYFTASSTTINSGEKVNLSWSINNSVGANLIIKCVSGITATSSINENLTLPCDTLAFPTALKSTDSIILTIKNKDDFAQTVFLSLIPSKKAGEYDATRGKQISISARSEKYTAQSSSSQQTINSNQINTFSSSSYSSSSSSKAINFIFLKTLKKGSIGLEVSRLQEFLKKDSSIYPEGIVSGYFGSATFRAVARFQKKYNITNEKDPFLGTVGPKTRAKLNEMR